MRKLSRIIAAHMELDTERVDQLIGLIYGRLQKRAERSGRKLQAFREGRPDDRAVEMAMQSSDEVKAFGAMLLLLEELLEDVDISELEEPPKASKVMN